MTMKVYLMKFPCKFLLFELIFIQASLKGGIDTILLHNDCIVSGNEKLLNQIGKEGRGPSMLFGNHDQILSMLHPRRWSRLRCLRPAPRFSGIVLNIITSWIQMSGFRVEKVCFVFIAPGFLNIRL